MRNQRRNVVAALSAIFVATGLVFTGCSSATDVWEEIEGEGPHVLVSFPPLYCFVKNVAGDHAKVYSLTATIGPHDYTPTAHDAVIAKKADLFLVNGLGLDDWITRIKNNADNPELKVVKIGAAIPKKLLLKAQEHEDHGHEGHHHHHHGEYDPHVWLGAEEAIILVNAVRDELSKIAPKHKEEYEKNAERYVEELTKLHGWGKKQFDGIKNPNIIATHDSLRYFARSYGVKVMDNLQPQPGIEADANKLANLIKIVTDEKNPVRVLTVEPQYGEATANTLIQQVNSKKKEGEKLKMVVFDTIETAESRSKLDKDLYVTAMKKNIQDLAKALK